MSNTKHIHADQTDPDVYKTYASDGSVQTVGHLEMARHAFGSPPGHSVPLVYVIDEWPSDAGAPDIEQAVGIASV